MRRTALAAAIAAVILTCAACSGGDEDKTPTIAPRATPTATSVAPPAITIDQPAAGSTVKVPFQISGGANVFEGVLIVEVLDGGGERVCRHRVQATSGTGTPGTWSTTMAFGAALSSQQATIRAFDFSARDGSEENVVTRPVTVASDLPAIVISTPKCNAEVSQSATLAVSGTAQVFEGALSIDLRDSDGRTLLTQQAMASSGVEGHSPWQALLSLAGIAPGSYEVVAYDHSARDGSIENEFSVPITVTQP